MQNTWNKGLESFEDESALKAYLNAVSKMQGTISIVKNKLSFLINASDMAYAFSLVENVKSILPGGAVVSIGNTVLDKSHKKEGFCIEVEHPYSYDFLQKIGMLKSENGNVTDFNVDFPPFVDDAEKFRYYLRGAFDSRGKLFFPDNQNKEYRLEISPVDESLAETISTKAGGEGLKLKLSKRKDSAVLYSTDSEDIHDLLVFMFLPDKALELDDIIVLRNVSSVSAKQNNRDMWNIKRIVGASEKLREAVFKLKENGAYDSLDEESKQMIDLRLNGDGLSLEVIAEQLGVTKSCVNHRIRKIISLAFDKEQTGENK